MIYPTTYVASAHHGLAYQIGSSTAISPTTTAVPYFDYATIAAMAAAANGASGAAGAGVATPTAAGAGQVGFPIHIPTGLEAAYTYAPAAPTGYLPAATYPAEAAYPGAFTHQIVGSYPSAAAAAHYQP